MGCFDEDASARALPNLVLTGGSGPRAMSVNTCATAALNTTIALAAAATSGGSAGGGSRPVFIALQRNACFGAVQLPANFLTGRMLPPGACGTGCPGAPQQQCGGGSGGSGRNGSASHVAVSVYRLLHSLLLQEEQ